MKIVIPVGTGQVGTILSRSFHRDGHDVVALGRSPKTNPWRTVNWDAATLGEWAAEVDGADVVINLAGRSVNCRYGTENRETIARSRVDTTRLVGKAIAAARRPPRAWLQASTATIYAHRFDAPNDEATGIIGGTELEAPDTWRFSIEVAKAWEQALDDAAVPGTRKVKLRSAMTMSPDRGGIFDTLLALVRRGLGGTAGSGRQYISWIHEVDFVRAVNWIIDHDHLDGVVNLAATHPWPNREFMRALRAAWGAPFGMPATRWMLEIGAVLMRTETELVLKSRRVVPGILLRDGFSFEFPTWPEAARDLCRRWREERRGARGAGSGERANNPRVERPVKILRIDHVQLAMPEGQEASARDFYGRLLGIPEVEKPPALAQRGGVWFEDGDVKLHLGVEAGFRPARKAHPALIVRDLKALAQRLLEAGVEVVADDLLPGHDRVYVTDPFGNRLELMEPR